jgi:NTP pyrophosphatase (non-canonical NTP hydrolase)
VEEELAEVREAFTEGDKAHLEEELGDRAIYGGRMKH